MKLWKIYRDVKGGWDTYDSAVVVAPNIEAARTIHPDGRTSNWSAERFSTWAPDPQHVGAICIGEAVPNLEAGTVVVASFNAS